VETLELEKSYEILESSDLLRTDEDEVSVGVYVSFV
jgi:hypothetical protein